MSENTVIEITNSSNNINVSELGVKFSESLTIEEWENFGEQIGRVVNSSQFIIGDWLNFGRGRWENKKEYAERISVAEDKTGLDSVTLKTYASVARRIPFCNRNSHCSFCHHVAVAKLEPEEQSKWLDIADDRDMSVRTLKTSIKVGEPIAAIPRTKTVKTQSHTFDDCSGFVYDIERWYTRKKNAGYFEKLTLEQLTFHRDKLKPVAEIYNEFNAMIREKQKEEN